MTLSPAERRRLADEYARAYGLKRPYKRIEELSKGLENRDKKVEGAEVNKQLPWSYLDAQLAFRWGIPLRELYNMPYRQVRMMYLVSAHTSKM